MSYLWHSWGNGRTRCLRGVRSVVHPTQSDIRAEDVRIHSLGHGVDCLHGYAVQDVSAVELQVAVHPVAARAADIEATLPPPLLLAEAAPSTFSARINGMPHPLGTVLRHEVQKFNVLLDRCI